MRGPMQAGPMQGFAGGGGQPGRPDTGSMPLGQMQQQPYPGKLAQAPAQKLALYRPPRRTRVRIDPELSPSLYRAVALQSATSFYHQIRKGRPRNRKRIFHHV